MSKITDKKQSFEQGALVLLLAAILSKLIGALFKIPLSSQFCLGDLGFGYFSAAYDLINPIILLSVSGLPVAVSRLVSEYYSVGKRAQVDKVFLISRRIFLILGVSASIIALALIIPLIKAADSSDNSLYCYLAIIPSFVFCCLSSAYRGYFEGHTNMLPPAISSVIEALSKLILGFSFALITVRLTKSAALGGAAALFGITLGTLLSCIYLHISYKKNCNLSAGYTPHSLADKKLIKKILAIAFPIALYSFSGSVVGLVDSITVRWQLSGLFDADYSYFENLFSTLISESNSVEQLVDQATLPTFLYGIRSKAYTLYNIVPTLTAYLGVSAVPHIATAFEKGDKQSLKNSCCKVLKSASVISFPAGFGFIALNERIMFLLYGKSCSSQIGGKMLIAFGVATVLAGISVVMGNILQGVGKQKIALFNVAVGVAVKIILNLLLCGIPALNIYGSVISTALCYAVIFILNIISVSKILGGIHLIGGVFLKPLVAALVCSAAAFAVSLMGRSSLITVASVGVAVIIYLIFLILLRVFSADEIAELPFGNQILRLFFRLKTKK